jgi:alpha-glucuronidase
MLKRIGFSFAVGLALVSGAGAQTANLAWLKYPSSTDRSILPLHVRLLGRSPLELSALQELTRSNMGFTDLPNPRLPANSALVLGTSLEVSKSFPQLHIPAGLGPDGYWLTHVTVRGDPVVVVAGTDDGGVLHGAFALLRRLRQGELIYPVDVQEQPAMPIRWVDEWDNADGSIERGYAGRSIFFEGGKVRDDLAPIAEYARLLASVGINGCNVNNVNNAAAFLEPEMLQGIARAASTMRPWGVRLALSVDIASPQKIGGLSTYDPLDPAVKAWWAAKVSQIYALIPDFAGFTVKADSEGQPGPASYGRTPTDAANLLAGALQPHGGVVLYRAFVYNHHLDWRDPKADRARAAYDIFHPLDGKFAANVIVQTKEGPIDFQAREPVSPLFAGLEKTSQAMEVQITQEYTGQQRRLVYLAPMWKQVLDFDMRAPDRSQPRSTPVKEILEGRSFNQPLGGIVGVAGVGREAWLGSPLAMANLYAFGRLAWNPDLAPEQIAEEWIKQTISTDPEVVSTVRKMLMQSWPAYEHYTGPLGIQTLTDITGSHYGPNIESSENNGWGQWHRADHEGVGMDRSVATGTGFAGQYPPEVTAMYEKPATTPDNLLLFFHHVPYTYKLQDGKTVIQYIYDSHYEGAAEAAELGTEWATLKGRIDPALFDDVRMRLEYQAGHAIVWRDAIVQYFLKLSGIADERRRAGHYPGRLEAEDARLTGYKVIDVTPWEDASGGRAVSCQGTTSQLAEKAVRTVGRGFRAVGRGFIPGISDAMSTRALAPEVCFSETSLETIPFPTASSVVPNTPERNDVASAPEDQPACSAAWTYSGQPGRFDIAVQYFDLQGGTAKFKLDVNSQTISTWTADAAFPSHRPNGDNSTRSTARDVALKPGDVIRIEGMPDGADAAALDYVEVLPRTAQPD